MLEQGGSAKEFHVPKNVKENEDFKKYHLIWREVGHPFSSQGIEGKLLSASRR